MKSRVMFLKCFFSEITQTKWEPKLTNNCEKENAANVKTPTVKANKTHKLKLAHFGEAKDVIPDVFLTLDCSLFASLRKSSKVK